VTEDFIELLLLSCSAATLPFFQEAFADTDGIGADFNKLIGLDILHCQFETHLSSGTDLSGIVFARRSDIGHLLGPCDVYGDVIILTVLADDLAFSVFVFRDARRLGKPALLVLPSGTLVPNDLELNGTDKQILVLTGPNMSGKSTYLRQAALITILGIGSGYGVAI
jgi:hypothetical protein